MHITGLSSLIAKNFSSEAHQNLVSPSRFQSSTGLQLWVDSVTR